MKKVSALKTEIRKQVWPSGEAENLISGHDGHFQEAFAEIAKWVDSEREDNVSLIEFGKTNYNNGLTVVSAPRGVILRVFTVANDDYSDPVFYRRAPWPAPEEWARNLYDYPKQLTKLPRLPMGFELADIERDSIHGRARTGIWSLSRGNLYLAPWIQSNELLIIEWQGIKDLWGENDLINPEIPYYNAVKLFMQYAHERDYGTMQRAVAFHHPATRQGLFDDALADLIYLDRERTKANKDQIPNWDRRLLTADIVDDAPPTTPDGIILSDVGNVSLPGEDLDDVGELVRGIGPSSIIASGIIGGTMNDYDLSAGLQFHSWMKPYAGNQGAGGERNAFWPALSAADRTLDGGLTFNEFFGGKNNGKYYAVVLGDVHLFVLDTGDPDGITSSDPQATWLQAQLAMSTAPWKVVKMDLCPWGSVHSTAALQWAFKAWGADLVLCSQARNYERLDIAGLPVINNGLGGAIPIEEITAPTANTVVSYSADFGAGRIQAKTDELVYRFITVNGETIDTLVLDK